MQDKVIKSKPRLVRKQILITPEQARQLKARSEATGLAEAEIVRQALDREIGQVLASNDGWKQRLLKLAGTLDEAGIEDRLEKNRKQWNDRVAQVGKKLRGEE